MRTVKIRIGSIKRGIKKAIASRLLTVTVLFTTCNFLFSMVFASVSFSLPLTGVPASIKAPSELAEWFSDAFEYRFEMIDDPQKAQDTINSKEGDCEDFAVLASAILSDLGILNDVLVVNFTGLHIGHAICIWKDEAGMYSFFSNRTMFFTGIKNRKEAIERYYPDCSSISSL